MSRKHQIDVVRVHLPQALQELLEGVVRGEPRRNRRRYALQHVVADDHELAVGLVQADMPRIVSWRFDHLERETSGAQHVALVQVDEIGLARQRQQLGRYVQAMLALAEHESALLRRRRLAQQGAEHVRLHLHEILHLFERVEVRIHAHTVAVDPIEIARMVGIECVRTISTVSQVRPRDSNALSSAFSHAGWLKPTSMIVVVSSPRTM